MSYDVTFVADVGADEAACLEDGWRNYTSNVSPMWYEALGGITLGDLIDATPVAADLEPKIREAIAIMSEAPYHFRAMNPSNGWGDYDGALDYLKWIAERCARWPKARVEASR